MITGRGALLFSSSMDESTRWLPAVFWKRGYGHYILEGATLGSVVIAVPRHVVEPNAEPSKLSSDGKGRTRESKPAMVRLNAMVGKKHLTEPEVHLVLHIIIMITNPWALVTGVVG